MLSDRVRKALHACSPRFLHPFFKRIQASSVARRLTHGAFWSLFGAVVSRVLTLAAFVVVARILGKESYGRFGIVQSTIAMFGLFAGFEMGVTSNKYIAECRDTDPNRAGRIMGMAGLVAIGTGLTLAAGLYFLAPWLAAETLNDPELTPLLRIGALILMLEAMNGAQMGALGGFEAFKRIAKVSMWVGLATFPMLVIGLQAGGLPGVVWALAASRGLNWAMNHLALRQVAAQAGVPFVWRFSTSELALLWRFSLPAMLSGVMTIPTVWVCNAMLVHQADGYGQMGILQATRSIQQIIMFVGATVGAPLLPMLSHALGTGRQDDRLSRINVLSAWALGLLPAMLLMLLPELGLLMFGRGYAGPDFSHTYTFILLGTCIVMYRNGLWRILMTHGLMWWDVGSNLVWGAMIIGFTHLFISHGAAGYAFAWTLAYVLSTLVFIPLFSRKKLIPKGSLISTEAGLIWLLLLTSTALSLVHAPVFLRIGAFPVLGVIACGLFWRLLTRHPAGCDAQAGTGVGEAPVGMRSSDGAVENGKWMTK